MPQRHKRRRKLVPLVGAASVLVAGAALGVTRAAQAANTPSTGAADCVASWYGATDEHVEGAATASGEPFHAALMTAASRDLPFGTVVKVTDKHSANTVTVKINDRGPFTDPAHRCIDLSAGAFAALGENLCSGVTDVHLDIMPAGTPLSPTDPNFKPISMSQCPPGSGGPTPNPAPTPTSSPTAKPTPAPTATPTATAPPTASPTGSGCSAPAWSHETAYVGGTRVSYGGRTWTAKWWTQGDVPGHNGQDVWTDSGTCAG
ncbi:septal ring lytic transglycosylase RlpA family protein [Streptomyces sp. NPDC020096]